MVGRVIYGPGRFEPAEELQRASCRPGESDSSCEGEENRETLDAFEPVVLLCVNHRALDRVHESRRKRWAVRIRVIAGWVPVVTEEQDQSSMRAPAGESRSSGVGP